MPFVKSAKQINTEHLKELVFVAGSTKMYDKRHTLSSASPHQHPSIYRAGGNASPDRSFTPKGMAQAMESDPGPGKIKPESVGPSRVRANISSSNCNTVHGIKEVGITSHCLGGDVR